MKHYLFGFKDEKEYNRAKETMNNGRNIVIQLKKVIYAIEHDEELQKRGFRHFSHYIRRCLGLPVVHKSEEDIFKYIVSSIDTKEVKVTEVLLDNKSEINKEEL